LGAIFKNGGSPSEIDLGFAKGNFLLIKRRMTPRTKVLKHSKKHKKKLF